MTVTTMAQALNAALRDALHDDDSVVVFGEDVGTLGGVFRVTDGLTETFGANRCFDTPLAESGIIGFAVGMAMGAFARWSRCNSTPSPIPRLNKSCPTWPNCAIAPAVCSLCPW
ncbi:hypothetical protein Isolate57596_08910 [Mycobacteroides abscessus subsp. abscessus]